MTTLVIGYGNPLRGDDALGWHVAERVEPKLINAEVLACHQLTPELAEPLSRADLAIFVDASHGDNAGEVSCVQVRPADGPLGAMVHQTSPDELMALARDLYGRVPDAYLFAVVGGRFDLHEGLSPEVDAACDRVALSICDLVAGFKAKTDVHPAIGAPGR